MCLCNLTDEIEYLNMISNDDQKSEQARNDFAARAGSAALSDKPTAEGAARLDAALAEMGDSATQRLLHDVKVQAAKVEMFDELVDALAYAAGAAQSQIECSRFFSLLAKAHKLQREPPCTP